MPIYGYACTKGHAFDAYLPLARYKEPQRCPTCQRMGQKILTPPRVMADCEGYNSPVTGEWISGRKQRREDLKRHGCIEYDPEMRKDAERFNREADKKVDRMITESLNEQFSVMPEAKRKLLEQL